MIAGLVTLLLVGGSVAYVFGRVYLADRFKDAVSTDQRAFNRRRTWQGYGALAAALASFTGVAVWWWMVR
jgi:hypothetical protein